MSFVKSEFSFPSNDGRHTAYATVYAPAQDAPRGVVQLSHGMIDYVGRYEALAEFLCSAGYVLAGNDHLGHGRTAEDTPDDYGFFADRDGVGCLLSDLNKMNALLREKYPSSPIFLMGHSMGSFLSRLYAAKYPETICGHIIHGTGGPMGAILPMGKLLVKLNSLLRGKRNRSKFVAQLAFAGYNKRFGKDEGIYAWLTRDISRVSGRSTDSYTNFIFTVSAYYDLFTMVGECNGRKWFRNYPKDMKTLILSGDMDPVGNYGKGPSYVYKKLIDCACTNVELKLYEGARHELFNELCRDQVFSDIQRWLDKTLKQI